MKPSSHPVMTRITKLSPWMTDLTGMISGKLTIIEPYGCLRYPSGSMATFWVAKCECGNTHITQGQGFLRGDIQSCGCIKTSQGCLESTTLKGTRFTPKELRKSGHRFPDLYDQTFGKLTVIDLSHGMSYIVHGKKRVETKWRIYWNCICACGKQVTRSSRYLMQKNGIRSCGCSSKKSINIRRKLY